MRATWTTKADELAGPSTQKYKQVSKIVYHANRLPSVSSMRTGPLVGDRSPRQEASAETATCMTLPCIRYNCTYPHGDTDRLADTQCYFCYRKLKRKPPLTTTNCNYN